MVSLVTVVYSDGVAFKFFPSVYRPWVDADAKQRADYLRLLSGLVTSNVAMIARREEQRLNNVQA